LLIFNTLKNYPRKEGIKSYTFYTAPNLIITNSSLIFPFDPIYEVELVQV